MLAGTMMEPTSYWRVLVVTMLAAMAVSCGAKAGPGPATTGAAKGVGKPGLAAVNLAWLAGHWAGEGTSETWVVAGDALIGVGFGVRGTHTLFFEVMIAREIDGALTLTALPNGLKAVDFPADELQGQKVGFANPDNHHPQRIRYHRDQEILNVYVGGPNKPESETVAQRVDPVPSPALEEIDRRFAADAAARGADSWAETYEPEGAIWTRRSGFITGTEAIRANMAGVFESDSTLDWEPRASGLSPGGDMGFTTGRYRLLRRAGSGATAADKRVYQKLEGGYYVTVWRRQPDGAWRAVFDAGLPDPGIAGASSDTAPARPSDRG